MEAQFVAINLVAIFVVRIIRMHRLFAYILFCLGLGIGTMAATPSDEYNFLAYKGDKTTTGSPDDASLAAKNQTGSQYEDEILDPDIKTVLFYPTGAPLNPPVINLGTQEVLQVRFDDHYPQTRAFAYTVEHCTHDWKSSELVESEYIDGFFSHYVNDYSNSFNTIHQYTHHQFSFPNRDLQLLRSGNYILKVWLEGEPEKVIFTRRFMVVESKVHVQANVVAPRNVAMRHEGHEIQFSLHHGEFPINNPYRDLHVKLLQNQQWSTAITDLKPVFVKSNELVYDYDAPATFMAGNEYRPLDLKSFRYAMEYIRRSERTPLGHKIVLQPDEKRVFKQYLSLDDINGRFLIKNDDGYDDHTESDYATVYFSLAMDQPLIGSDIYIYGGFNAYACNNDNKLTYNADLGLYQGQLLLKQGFYNYQYAVVEHHNPDKPDLTILEGSFKETENDYTILVYYRDFSNNYDQLVGVSFVYANKR